MRLVKKLAVLAATGMVAGVCADSITHGGTTINMDFVDIGYAGNSADTTGYGAVGYNYRIGTYEVMVDQWASVIAADSNVGGGSAWSGSQPVAITSWYEAAKLCNWLTSGTYNQGAYQFSDPNTLTGVDRDTAVATYGTVYVLPAEDEWYKAAYFKSDGSGYTLYASGNSIPGFETDANYGGSSAGAYSEPWNVGTGGIAENNGTFDMNGNVREWNEDAFDGTLDNMTENRVFRGGSYNILSETELRSSERLSSPVWNESHTLGFRVAVIPEPSTIAFVGVFGGGLLFIRRYFPSV